MLWRHLVLVFPPLQFKCLLLKCITTIGTNFQSLITTSYTNFTKIVICRVSLPSQLIISGHSHYYVSSVSASFLSVAVSHPPTDKLEWSQQTLCSSHSQRKSARPPPTHSHTHTHTHTHKTYKNASTNVCRQICPCAHPQHTCMNTRVNTFYMHCMYAHQHSTSHTHTHSVSDVWVWDKLLI